MDPAIRETQKVATALVATMHDPLMLLSRRSNEFEVIAPSDRSLVFWNSAAFFEGVRGLCQHGTFIPDEYWLAKDLLEDLLTQELAFLGNGRWQPASMLSLIDLTIKVMEVGAKGRRIDLVDRESVAVVIGYLSTRAKKIAGVSNERQDLPWKRLKEELEAETHGDCQPELQWAS